MTSIISRKRSLLLIFQPAPAWIAILSFIFITILLGLIGAGKILNIAFPLGAFIVALSLYRWYPILYLGFSWWILFLAPFVRRYADYRSGFTELSPILLAPYLVILVSLITLWQQIPRINQASGKAFLLTMVGIIYGFLIGLIQNSPISVCVSLLDWFCPLLLGFHIYINWRDYPSYRQNTQQVFLWGVLITGIYGIFQYIVAPEWDRYWRIQTHFISVGLPQPLTFNVFSTLNSNGPFAVMMMTGLIILISSAGNLRFLTLAIGFLAFFLSNVRAAWGGFLVGIIMLGNSLKPKQQMYLILTGIIIIMLVIPLITMEPFASKIGNRLATFANLENDASGQGRTKMLLRFIDSALTEFVGVGIGSGGFDNALLMFIFHLGYIGTFLYLSGMLQLFLQLIQGGYSRVDAFAGASRGIAIAMFSQLMLGPSMIELPGIILWTFLALGLAAEKYHQNELFSQPK